MEAKKILIAETSAEFVEHLCERLGSGYLYQICQNGLTVRRMLDVFRPDVLVMDLALPGLDGITLLKQITLLPFRPRILLTTCFISPYVEAIISGLGVDLVMLKPFRAEILAERIRELSVQDDDLSDFAPAQHRSTIATMLMDLNIPSKRRGFGYLEQGIRLYVEQPGQALTKNIYPDVAKDNYTQPEAVERAIRQVIHESWDKRDESVWRRYFRPGREGVIPRPTNAEFISQLAERYRFTLEELA